MSILLKRNCEDVMESFEELGLGPKRTTTDMMKRLGKLSISTQVSRNSNDFGSPMGQVLHRRGRKECDYSLSPVNMISAEEFPNGERAHSFVSSSNFHIPGMKKAKSEMSSPVAEPVQIEIVDTDDDLDDDVIPSPPNSLKSAYSDMICEGESNSSILDPSCKTLSIFCRSSVGNSEKTLHLPYPTLPPVSTYGLYELNAMKESSKLLNRLSKPILLEQFIMEARRSKENNSMNVDAPCEDFITDDDMELK